MQHCTSLRSTIECYEYLFVYTRIMSATLCTLADFRLSCILYDALKCQNIYMNPLWNVVMIDLFNLKVPIHYICRCPPIYRLAAGCPASLSGHT